MEYQLVQGQCSGHNDVKGHVRGGGGVKGSSCGEGGEGAPERDSKGV